MKTAVLITERGIKVLDALRISLGSNYCKLLPKIILCVF